MIGDGAGRVDGYRRHIPIWKQRVFGLTLVAFLLVHDDLRRAVSADMVVLLEWEAERVHRQRPHRA